MDEINKSQERVWQVKKEIQSLQEHLTQQDSQHQADLEQLDRDLEELLLNMEQEM